MNAKSTIAYFFSILGHPLFMIIYMMFFYMKANPYLFLVSDARQRGALFIIIFVISIFLPIFSMVLLRGVGFIESMEMKERNERIGPLIIILISYLWLYLNIRTNDRIPVPFATFVLGALISICFSFTINVFSKISLHGVGVGGFVAGLLFLLLRHGSAYINFVVFGNQFQIHAILLIALVLILSGVVLTSRLYLKAHVPQEIYGGVIVGALGQMLAYSFF